MVYREYCDKCGKEIAGWDNEYGQVMTVTIKIESESNGDNGIIDGKTRFCSAKCAVEFLKPYLKEEADWLKIWKDGKILGIAPVMPEKKDRRDM